MKQLHYTMMGVMLVAVLTMALGVTQPWIESAEAQHGDAAEAQHGHGAGVQEQFDAFAAHLGLSAEQEESISAPFHEGFNALQNLHRLHGMIAAELTDEQQGQFAEMLHEMMGASFAVTAHGH